MVAVSSTRPRTPRRSRASSNVAGAIRWSTTSCRVRSQTHRYSAATAPNRLPRMASSVASGTPASRACRSCAARSYSQSSRWAVVIAASSRVGASRLDSNRMYVPRWAARPATSGLCMRTANGPRTEPRLATIASQIGRWSSGTCSRFVTAGIRMLPLLRRNLALHDLEAGQDDFDRAPLGRGGADPEAAGGIGVVANGGDAQAVDRGGQGRPGRAQLEAVRPVGAERGGLLPVGEHDQAAAVAAVEREAPGGRGHVELVAGVGGVLATTAEQHLAGRLVAPHLRVDDEGGISVAPRHAHPGRPRRAAGGRGDRVLAPAIFDAVARRLRRRHRQAAELRAAEVVDQEHVAGRAGRPPRRGGEAAPG